MNERSEGDDDAVPADAEASTPEAESPKREGPAGGFEDREPTIDLKPFIGLVIGAGLGLVAIAAILFAVLPRHRASRPAAATTARLAATVESLVRSGSEQGGGLLVQEDGRAATAPVAEGAAIRPGSTLHTDDRTRARLLLADGSRLTLQQDTVLRLDPVAPRDVHLVRGEVYAEMAHRPAGPPARFHTAGGTVEVVGTKLLLTASEEGTSARVTQGVVAMESDGSRVEVKAGEEGLLTKGRAPVVLPAVGLGASVAWTELGDAPGDDLPLPGLGELRAHEPGEREDRERPLRLARHAVKVRIAGNVARTEIEETFQNDGPDTLEGIYSFPLPSDARIASLALEVDGRWEDGSFVARDRAERIWRGVIRNATPEVARRPTEEFIWVPGPWRDPALLEWQQGGRFELRIFPIPAHGARRIRIAYEQTVAPHGRGRRYVYPLPHGGTEGVTVGRFEADVRVAGVAGGAVRASGYDLAAERDGDAERLAFTSDDFHPSGALIIDYAPRGDEAALRYWTFEGPATASAPAASREGDDAAHAAHQRLDADARPYVAFALRPELPAWSSSTPRDYLLVIDASQSMFGERYERAVRLTEAIIAEMDPRDRVAVMACDATCRAMDRFEAPHSASAAHARAFLEKQPPAGASHVAKAIREAFTTGERLGASRGAPRELHVLYVGDGLASVGPRRAGSLAAEVREARRDHRASLTTVGIGQEADAVVLAAIARAGGGHYVPYVPGERAREAALGVLETTYGASVEDLEVKLPEGITDVAPAVLPNLRAGEELWVVGRLAGPVRGEVEVRGSVGGEPWQARYPVDVRPTRAAGNAFVPRLWASATIADLELDGRGEDVAEVVALSKAFHVMSRHTSLLVLESEAMFRAFGVDRARPAVEWTGEEEMTTGLAEAAEGAIETRASSGSSGGAGRGAASEMERARRAPPRALGAPAPSVAADEASFRPSMAPPMPPPRRGRMMRRVRFLEGHIERSGVRDADRHAVAEAEAALRENPDSRDRHRALVRALNRAGELDRAEAAVEAWLARDALDPEALTYKSDVLGRLGRRDEALRTLTGVVDLERDNEVLHQRLVSAFDRIGDASRACDHRVALAEIDPDDAEVVADALRCERRRGRASGADRLLRMASSATTRERIDALSARGTPAESMRGDLVLEATWSGGDAVDLSLVTPQGTRLSWMGGRRAVVASDGQAAGVERLGLRRASAGSYLVEVNRTSNDRGAPIVGQVRVRTGSETRVLPFELVGSRTVIGRVDVVRRWRLVPAGPTF
jgi:hypothetical protein